MGDIKTENDKSIPKLYRYASINSNNNEQIISKVTKEMSSIISFNKNSNDILYKEKQTNKKKYIHIKRKQNNQVLYNVSSL